MIRKQWITIMIVLVLAIAACGRSEPPAQVAQTPEITEEKPQEQAQNSEEKKLPATMAELAVYEGADRSELLLAGAKQEGILNIYTSRTVEDINAMKEGFEKKYGIPVEVWRASSTNVLQRVMTEAQADKLEADIVDINGPGLEALHREKLLQVIHSPFHAELIPQAVPDHKAWVATSLNLYVHSYNTSLIKEEELPKSYADLLDPKWKGMLGIEETNWDYLAVLVKQMGEEKGVQFWRDVVATNGMDVRKGNTLLTNLVRSGEVPLALTTYNFTAEQYRKEGGPFNWFVLEPAVARPNGIGVFQKAHHPHAALLFYDYMITEGQQTMVDLEFVPVNKNADSQYSKLNFLIADPVSLLDEENKWTDLYEEIFIKKK